MSISEHLNEAVDQAEEARFRIEAARQGAMGLSALREWLEALTEYAFALSDIHRYGNQSIHEKLHFLAGQLQIDAFPRQAGPEEVGPVPPHSP